MGAKNLWGMTNLNPKGIYGWQDLYTIYISCGPHGFREEDLKVFPTINLWNLLIPGVGPVWTQGLEWQNLCGGALDITILNI